jgi:hypothetical protein
LNRSIIFIIKLSAVILLVYSCANIGSPVGGPKDLKPPVVVETDPADSCINFTAQKKITITFNEFIVLKNILQELIISPPLKEGVTTYIKNKSLVIEFPKGVVFDTTTYTLSFGNSIVDNNEGNILTNYEFVFSLKNYIDSLNVSGKVVNSVDLKTDKERMFVMLYSNLADSAPIKEKPKYISRTDDQGNFSIHNLEPGAYRIFALKDANSNLLYDLPEEQIAFSDSVIELKAEKLGIDTILANLKPEVKTPVKKDSPDSEFKLTATPLNDTTRNDSIINIRKYVFHQDLRFFKAELKNQYMTNSLRTQRELLFFSFSQSLTDSFKINPLNISHQKDWFIADIDNSKDTLKYWIIDTSMISKDSLKFEAYYPIYDSMGNVMIKSDTLFLIYRDKEIKGALSGKKNRQRRQEREDTIPKPVKRLELSNNISNPSAFDLDRFLNIILSTPLKEVRIDKIKMSRFEDTIAIDMKPVIKPGNTLYNFTIDYKPLENTKYKVLIPDSTVFDIYGCTNDTTIISFSTQLEEFYGTLTMNLKNIHSPVILQLLDEKEILVKENLLSENQSVKYSYLVPKKYILKLIIDSNNNGKWDTGNYLLKRQPEKVIYYQQPINVRSNWEIELTWDIKE